MVLPTLNTPITTRSLYPDRIVANFQFQVPWSRVAAVIDAAFADFGRRKNARRGNMLLDSLDASVRVSAARSADRGIVSIYVTVSPLAVLHGRNDHSETSSAAQINWLHERDICQDNRHIWRLSGDLLFSAHTTVFRRLQEGLDSVASNRTVQPERSTLAEVEVVRDVRAADPRRMVETYARVLRRHFANVREQYYRSSALHYREDARDTLLVWGFLSENRRFKLYEKTNARVRLEALFKNNAIRAAAGTRSINNPDDDFPRIFGRLAAASADQFGSILRDVPQVRSDDVSPSAFVSAVHSRIRRPNVASQVLNLFIHSDRILAGSVDYSVIKNLVSANIIQRTRRGIYGLTARYRRAADVLRRVDLTSLPPLVLRWIERYRLSLRRKLGKLAGSAAFGV